MKTSMLFILAFVTLTSEEVRANFKDPLIHGCSMGVAVTQGYLDKDSDLDLKRMLLRCAGGVKNRPQIRKEFDAFSTLENKKAYACGFGVGVALSFYNKVELLSSKIKDVVFIIDECIRRL